MMTQLTIDLFNRCAELRGNVNLDEMHNCLDTCKDLLTTLLYEPPMVYEPKDAPEYGKAAVLVPSAPAIDWFSRSNPAHVAIITAWCKEAKMPPAWRMKHGEHIFSNMDGNVQATQGAICNYLDAYLAAHPEG